MPTPRALPFPALALALLAALAVAAPALAVDRCVNRPGCTPANTFTAGQLQPALTAAGAAGSGRVLIGPGTYTAPATGFELTTGGAVEVIGSGVGATVIQTGAGQAPSGYALRLVGGSSSVRGVTMRSVTPSVRGLLLSGTTQARQIAVEGTAAAANTFGVFLEGTGAGPLLEDATVAMAGAGATAVAMNSTSAVRTSSLRAYAGISFSMSAPQLANVSQVRIDAVRSGIAGDGGNITARDTLITVTDPTATAASAVNLNNGVTPIGMTLDRVTIVGTDGAGQTGVASRADSAGGDNATVSVRNSIIAGVGVPLRRTASAGSAALTTGFTNHASAGVIDQNTGTGAGSLVETSTTQHAAAFANAAAGDYRLAPASPLIDAGDPADTGTLDLLGGPRPIDGDGDGVARVDLGAIESPLGAASTPVAPVATAPGVGTDTTAPRLTRLRIAVLGRTARLRARVSEAGTLRLRITRVGVSGARIRVVPVGAAGRVTTRFRLPALGRYRVRVVARDLAGNTSRARTRTIVRKPLVARVP